MKLNHKYSSILFGMVFALGLHEFGNPRPIFRYLFLFMTGFSILLFWYNRRYLLSLHESINYWPMVRQILLIFSGLGIFLLLPSPFFRFIFLISLGVVTAFSQYYIDNSTENFILNLTWLVAFGLFISGFGIGYYFPKIVFLMLIITVAGVFVLSRSLLEFTPANAGHKTLASLALGLFSGELFWVLSFLPFHFAASGIILFLFYFFFSGILFYSFFLHLNKKKVQLSGLIAIIGSVIILFGSPWKIIN